MFLQSVESCPRRESDVIVHSSRDQFGCRVVNQVVKMATDGNLNNLLKWSIENSQTGQGSADGKIEAGPPAAANSGGPRSQLTPEMLQALMGGPSDADLMRESMTAIAHSEVSLEDKMVAFDNFEQLIENLDNANNIESLGLWPPLLKLLDSNETELRRYAAWCIGTAVQNNLKSQEKLMAHQGVEKLVHRAISDDAEVVRRKSIYALSSAVRNYQPAMDRAVQLLPKTVCAEGAVDAGNMDALDHIMQKLRDDSARKAS